MAQIDTSEPAPDTSNPDRIPLSNMTDEQIGALVRAQHNGKIIEYWSTSGQWIKTRDPMWRGHIAYRVRAKRETVSINGNVHGGSPLDFRRTKRRPL